MAEAIEQARDLVFHIDEQHSLPDPSPVMVGLAVAAYLDALYDDPAPGRHVRRRASSYGDWAGGRVDPERLAKALLEGLPSPRTSGVYPQRSAICPRCGHRHFLPQADLNEFLRDHDERIGRVDKAIAELDEVDPAP